MPETDGFTLTHNIKSDEGWKLRSAPSLTGLQRPPSADWVWLRTYRNQTEASSADFLWRLKRAVPMVIQKVLTDNGSQFTDRFTSAGKQVSGKHAFDLVCAEFGIRHRLAPLCHPQTNGMVERFNGRISDIVARTRFSSASQLETTLTLYLQTYNHSIPQRALKHQTPIELLKAWREKKPGLFVRNVYEHSGLDSYACGRNAQVNAKGFAPKSYPMAGCEWPLQRTRITQTVKLRDQELDALARARINPVVYETYTGGRRYVFRDCLTCALVSGYITDLTQPPASAEAQHRHYAKR